MLKKIALCALSCLFFGSLSAVNWVTYEKAQEEAKATKKPIVLVFSGTDWCVWCKKLDQEVLDQPAFDQIVANEMLFVLVDFPRKGVMTPELKELNNSLKKQYDVLGFPKVVVVSHDGKKLGSLGYQAGGPESYAKALQKIVSQ